jgi:hypothetical protein
MLIGELAGRGVRRTWDLSKEPSGRVFRVFIQNLEDVALRGITARLIVSIETSGGRFRRPVRVYAGPIQLTKGYVNDDKEFWVEFSELPENDTWVVECECGDEVEDVRARLIEVDGKKEHRRRFLLPVLAERAVSVRRDRPVDQDAPGVIATSIGAIATAYVLYAWLREPYPWESMDYAFVGVLVAVGILLAILWRRAVPPFVVQGYLKETRDPTERTRLGPSTWPGL